jgi:hypothetical protein
MKIMKKRLVMATGICMAFILTKPIYAADLYNEKMLTVDAAKENKYSDAAPGESKRLKPA